MKVIYLHIGCEKTGSTYLQNFLTLNEEQLRHHGFLYFDQHESRKLLSMLGFKRGDAGFRESDAGRQWYRDFLERIRGFDGNVIISQENFWAGDCVGLQDFVETLAGWTFKVVLYVRKQSEWLESWYQENVKQVAGFTVTMARWQMPLEYVDYSRRLVPWLRMFGKSALIVRVFAEKSLVDGDICLDFLALIKLDADTFKPSFPPSSSRNRRVPFEILETMRLLNRSLTGALRNRVFQVLLKEAAFVPGTPEKYRLLPDDSVQNLDDYFRESNRSLFSDFIDGLDAFPNTAARSAGRFVEQPDMPLDALENLAGILVRQQQTIDQLKNALLRTVMDDSAPAWKRFLPRGGRGLTGYPDSSAPEASPESSPFAVFPNPDKQVEIVPLHDISEFRLEQEAAVMNSTGNDPQLEVRLKGAFPLRKYLIKVALLSPAYTCLRIYPCSARRRSRFSGEGSVSVHVPEGVSENYVSVYLGGDDPVFRLDPGEHQGRYIILQIGVY